ncbi:MAG: YicC/YloC family endoribonuclease [Chitinophagaceae bacterium]
MLYSMTGYGRAEIAIAGKFFLIEIKSLNGKQFDLRMITPPLLKQYEIQIRNIINQYLERGSVECFISIKNNGNSKPVSINTDLLKSYYNTSKQVADELSADDSALLAAILRLPDVVAQTIESLNEEDWLKIANAFETALTELEKHRKDEGLAMEKDLLERLSIIENLQLKIDEIEPNRRLKIKENLEKLLSDAVGKDNIDQNRLEQELIYYIEKNDITEEQVRLRNHCNYFREILSDKEKSKGKKLGFVLQEFGREINTTGSKANDSQMQKVVVLMKDELEKMKEQVLNIL